MSREPDPGCVTDNLKRFGIDELEAEIARRKEAAKPLLPEPRLAPDFSGLVSTILGTTAQTLKDGYERDDVKQYVWEAALEAVYGPEYWVWRKAQPW